MRSTFWFSPLSSLCFRALWIVVGVLHSASVLVLGLAPLGPDAPRSHLVSTVLDNASMIYVLRHQFAEEMRKFDKGSIMLGPTRRSLSQYYRQPQTADVKGRILTVSADPIID